IAAAVRRFCACSSSKPRRNQVCASLGSICNAFLYSRRALPYCPRACNAFALSREAALRSSALLHASSPATSTAINQCFFIASPSVACAVAHVPLIGTPYPLLQADGGVPAQGVDGTAVDLFYRRSVGPRSVVNDLAREAHDAAYEFGELADADVAADADIDDALTVVDLHHVQAGGGAIVHVAEFAPWRARAPYRHARGTRHCRVVELAQSRGQHVRGIEIEVVAGAVEIGGQHRHVTAAVLAAVGLTELDPRDLRYRIPLVGGFERTAQQRVLAHRLRRHLRVDARAAQEQQLFHLLLVGAVDQIARDHEIVVDEVRGITVVGRDAADLRGGEEDVPRPRFAIIGAHRGLVAQIDLRAIGDDEVAVSIAFELAYQRRAHQTVMAGDVNAGISFHGVHSW